MSALYCVLFQVAHHQGYITVNWGKVDQSVKKAKRNIQNNADTIVPMAVQEVGVKSSV